MEVIDPDEGSLESLGPGVDARATLRDGSVVLTSTGRAPVRRRLLLFRPTDSAGVVLVDGRAYRGAIEVAPAGDGVRVVNVVAMEDYLVGVVGAELGHRSADEAAAVQAQAVVARTYAMRNADRWKESGFDLLAGTGSQMYRGVNDEDAIARAAVEATAGEILIYGGEPIDAFYSSTCGGTSEAGGAVFVAGDRPYLRAQPDLDADGRAWCRISPRFEWRENWNADQLRRILRRTLAAEGLPTARAGDLDAMRVLDRTPSGRVGELEMVGSRGRTMVRGSAIRRVLAPTSGGILESTDFTVRISRRGGRIESLRVDGRGLGHGVGLCQWGAIGRARAGQGYRPILMHYFPGTDLQVVY